MDRKIEAIFNPKLNLGLRYVQCSKLDLKCLISTVFESLNFRAKDSQICTISKRALLRILFFVVGLKIQMGLHFLIKSQWCEGPERL